MVTLSTLSCGQLRMIFFSTTAGSCRPILKKSNKAEKAPKKRRPSAKAKAAAKAKVLWQNLVLPNPPEVMQSPDPEREVSSSGL